MKYKCILSYDGYSYNGYQKQKHDKNTIQEVVENALSRLFKEKIDIFASGRTDKKVHALGQVFHFESKNLIPLNNLKKAINELLPNDISIKKVNFAKDNFHARYSVKKKIYVYKIKYGKEKNVFDNRYYAYVNKNLNLKLLEENSQLFVGEHDFKNFTTNKKDEVVSFIKTIYYVKVKMTKNKITIEFCGSGFLRYQVRMMVGALFAIASGQENKEFINHLLENNVDNRCSYKAKPEGLYLKKVIY